ncbi:hypothetical protein ADEAN_000823800 [Angomonas deanei]|uniref:Uncharacterized protein n=1 Tax=Angomonas deanei TaxID=59799 RepID=A0A7G2CLL4_9TRYP|nr:hypothetical protein ADEAN_000823800 [Angomonas deanei]
MQLSPASTSLSRYIPSVGRTFLCDLLYSNKYCPHLGLYVMPYVYVKTLLLCAAGEGLEMRERAYVTGLIEMLLPSNATSDNLAKLDLIQFIEAVPGRSLTPSSMMQHNISNNNNNNNSTTKIMDTETAVRQLERDHHDEVSTTHLFNSIFYDSHTNNNNNSNVDNTNNNNNNNAVSADTTTHQSKDNNLPTAESMSSFINSSTFPGSLAHILLYDAISCCVADGVYSFNEKKRVALVSSQVGLSTAEKEQIERIALQERVLAVRKAKLLLLPSRLTNSSNNSHNSEAQKHKKKEMDDIKRFLMKARSIQ